MVPNVWLVSILITVRHLDPITGPKNVRNKFFKILFTYTMIES